MSFQVREKVILLPAVPTTQNGQNIAHTLRTVYDESGRVVWAKSPRGFITHFQYDALTGAMTRRIDDVNISRISGVPGGWSTPQGGGTHLISDFKMDVHGRGLRSLGPEHRIQLLENDTITTLVRRAEFRLYRDVMQEEWSALGYERVRDGLRSRHVVGPVRRIKRDQAGRVTDEILVTRTSDSWAPTLTEMEDRSKWCGWKRHFYDIWGRVTEVRVYHTIPSSGDGSATTHYDKATLFYDVRGRQVKTVDATGTITRTVYDVRDFAVETWVGTDDEGATDTDPSGSGDNDMTKVSESEFDGGADGGNGNLTRTTGFTGESNNDRESLFEYDFRDRLVKSRAVEAKSSGSVTAAFLTEVERDGLGRAAITYRYREQSGSSSLLISKSESSYDTRGLSFRQEVKGVEWETTGGVTTGTETEFALTTEQWFDANGNVIKSRSPGSEARVKLVYDGLDRGQTRYIVLENEPLPPGSGSGISSGSPSSSSSPSSDSSSSDSVSGSFSSPASEDDDDDEDEPDDEIDPGSHDWPINRPTSSDDRIIIPHPFPDPPDPGPGVVANDIVVVSDKTCPNCCDDDGEGGWGDIPPSANTPSLGGPGTCGETSDGEMGPCPVHYATGQKALAFTDMSLPGNASQWGHTRVVNNIGAHASRGAHGPGVTVRQQPNLAALASGQLAVIGGGTRNTFFNQVSGTIRAAFGGDRAQLTRQAGSSGNPEQYTFTNRGGAQRIFYGHDSTVPDPLKGKLKQVVNRSTSQSYTPEYSSGGALLRVTLPAAGTTRRMEVAYDYYPGTVGGADGNAGRLKTVQLECGAPDFPEERRRVRYDYYSSGSDHGAAGDLRLVSHEEWDGDNWVAVRCEYYRYYKTDHSDEAGLRGNTHRLKYVVGPAGCVALGDPSTYDSKANGDILAVSRYFFEYYSDNRIFREFMNGGTLVHEFTYDTTTVDPLPDFTGFYDEPNSILNTNVWYTRTIETVKDTSGAPGSSAGTTLSQKVVYTNRMGKVILSTLHEYEGGTATGKVWHTHNVFDSDGRFARRASPFAVNDVTEPAGLDDPLEVELKDDAGSIRDIAYYTSTGGNGEVEGLVATETVRAGTGDTTGFITSRYRYGTRTVGGISIYPMVYEAHYAKTYTNPVNAENTEGARITCTKLSYHGESVNTYVGTFPVVPADVEHPVANDVSEDIVFEQQKRTFDAGRNLVFIRSYQRFHNAVLPGELNGPDGASPRARRSYAAFYPDPLGRPWLTADFGTHSGQQMSRPAICPSLVTHTADEMKLIKTTRIGYNARGEDFQFKNSEGIITEWTNDCAGRRTQLVENVSGSTGPDRNRTTSYQYLPGGLLEQMSILNASTGTQVTTWMYGTEKDTSGSLIGTGYLLRRKKYDTDSGDNFLLWHYNQLGEVRSQKDANGTIRGFTRDRLARLTNDHVETLGSGVNGTIRTLTRTYDAKGRLWKAASKNSSGTVVNEAGFEYNAFGQMTADRQSHYEAIDWDHPNDTPSVKYGYAEGARNHLRLTSLTYPDGRVLEPGYNTSGSWDDRLSRPRQLGFTNDANPAVQYLYAGLSWIVEAAYPEPQIQMTHHNLGGTSTGDGGDQYLGVDRFGRLEQVRWHRIASPDAFIEHLTFGYDKADNRTWRLNHLESSTFDEHYLYDGLYQMKSRKRGNLNPSNSGISSTPSRQEDLTYDPLGNWNNYLLKIDGSTETDQTRTHNKSNQITALDSSSSLVAHDANGNMTKTAPDRDGDWSKGYLLSWDAWNRLIVVAKQESSSTIVDQYQYDALFRRIIRRVNGGDMHEYWDAAWHLLEERPGISTVPFRQYLWGIRQRNDLILRDAQVNIESGSGSSDSSVSGTTTDRRYVAYDWINPTVILSADGTILGRQSFSAFGIRAILRPDWDENESVPELADWNFGFQGQFESIEVAWLNYGYRYYQPYAGRWSSRDLILTRSGENEYNAYLDNPVSHSDLFGLAVITGTNVNGSPLVTNPMAPYPIPPSTNNSGTLIKTIPFEESKVDPVSPTIENYASQLGKRLEDPANQGRRNRFLKTQHCILQKLNRDEFKKKGCCLDDLKEEWLRRIIQDFMSPLLNALDGLPDERWKQTLENVKSRGEPSWLPGYGDWYNDAMAGREMAMTHIEQDLRKALEKHGHGDDQLWKCLGDIVADCEKENFAGIERGLSKLGGLASESLDVAKLRDSMRNRTSVTDPLNPGGPFEPFRNRPFYEPHVFY